MAEEINQAPANRASMTPMIVVVLIVLLLIGGGFLLFSRSSQNTNQTTSQNAIPESVNPTSTAEVTGATGDSMTDAAIAKEFSVEGGSFYFKPNEIRVKAGDKVKIVFTSKGGTHDFVIEQFDVTTKVLSNGQTETVEFTPDKAGSYEFYCSVGNHRAMGMKGTLVVE